MQLIHKRLIYQIIGAFIALLALTACFILLDKAVNAPDLDFGGDKSSVFIVIFVILPIGSLAGIHLIDRLFFSFQGYNFAGIALGFILSILLGGIGGVLLLDKIGLFAVFFLPLIIVGLSLLGYYLPSMTRRKSSDH